MIRNIRIITGNNRINILNVRLFVIVTFFKSAFYYKLFVIQSNSYFFILMLLATGVFSF